MFMHVTARRLIPTEEFGWGKRKLLALQRLKADKVQHVDHVPSSCAA